MSVYPSPSVQVNLLALISPDTALRRHVKNEWVGGCPLCGEGTDRFVVWPYDPHPRWWCRRCEKRGDAITYLMLRDGIGFRAACERLEGIPAMAALVRREAPEMSEQQRATFQQIADQCQWEALCADRPRAWLHARGLDNAAIKGFHLGYSPGKPGATTGIAGCRVACGITIPLWGVDGLLYGVSVRRAAKPEQWPADKDWRYTAVTGSQVPLYGQPCAHPGGTLIIVEGYFDAILLHRLAGHLVDVVALGTCRADVDARWQGHLCQYSRWLICTDNDQAGEKAAAGWCAWSERASRLAVPSGKDVTEYWQGLAGEIGGPGADQMVTDWIEDSVQEVAA